MRGLVMAALAALLVVAPAWAQTEDNDDRETDVLLERALNPWFGDFDAIKEEGFIRVGVPHNPLFFAFDGRKRAGLSAERGRALEAYWLKKHKKRITVVFLPKARDALLPALIDGKIDMIDANLTITPERQEKVDFSLPIRTGVQELIVTHKDAGELQTFDDLAGLTVFLRESSSYFTHMAALNKQREAEGKPAIKVEPADHLLEDNDLLEMVNGGIISATVVDDHKAELWAQVYPDLEIQENLVLNDGGEIAFALRKDSPQLKAELDAFSKTVKIKTQLGNVLHRRYLESTKWVTKVERAADNKRVKEAIQLVKKYSEEYGFDWLLIAAQGYQESGLDQSRRSHVGAIGIMQVMPATAKDPNVAIKNIDKAEPNVHAGVKYLRFLRDHYFDDPAIDDFDQVLMSLAAYNAGPGNIRKSRRRAEKMGLDPNVWFGNVEIATARAVSGEPVVYVRNITKYAVDLRLSTELTADRTEAEKDAAPQQ